MCASIPDVPAVCQVEDLIVFEVPCVDMLAREGGGSLARQAAEGFM